MDALSPCGHNGPFDWPVLSEAEGLRAGSPGLIKSQWFYSFP